MIKVLRRLRDTKINKILQKLRSTFQKMFTFSYKSVVVVVVSFILSAFIEGADLSHSRKCLKKAGKFPVPGSFCTSFYICENWRILREESCPQDQHFNPNKEWCDEKELYPCLERPRRKECPQSNGRFLKNGTECQFYFDCCNGEPTEKKCPKGELFDAKSGKCDWEELVECDGSSKNKECPKPNGKFLKLGTKCKVYFECCKGKAKEKKCSNHHLFSTKTGKCERKERVNCKEQENNKCPKANGRFLKSGTECKAYFECRRGRATEKKCPKNQLFDYKAGKCDREELVTCKDDTSSESSSSESKESYEKSTPNNKITSPPTSPDTISEELISDSTTGEAQSSSPVTFSTPEKVESPLPTDEITNTEASYSTANNTKSEITEDTTLLYESTSPEITSESRPQEENLSSEPTTKSILDPITKETTVEDILPSTHSSTQDPKVSTIEEILSSYQTESTTKSILEPITKEQTAEDILPSTYFPTEDPEVSTVEEISSSYQTEPTTKSILEPITKEQTVEDILSSTYFPTEDPDISTDEEISSSYQTEQPSSYGSKETIVEKISTEPEQTSSSLKTTQFSRTDDITSKIVDIISSDSTSETISSVATKSEISSTSAYLTTIDPVLVGFVCPEASGYYPHPTNKHKFIGCVHSIAYIMDCPSKLVYNDQQKRCLYDN